MFPFCKTLFRPHLKSARAEYVRLGKRLNYERQLIKINIQLYENLVGEVRI